MNLIDTINSDNWIYRQAALVAFSATLEGPTKEKIENMINLIIQRIMQLISDPKDRVKIAAASTLSKISELYPHMILMNANFVAYNDVLLSSLNLKPKVF